MEMYKNINTRNHCVEWLNEFVECEVHRDAWCVLVYALFFAALFVHFYHIVAPAAATAAAKANSFISQFSDLVICWHRFVY